MSTSRETINKDQPGDSPIEICQTKMPKSLGKRKLVPEVCNPIKQCKLPENEISNPDACGKCNKKLSFISTFKCRCERYFCSRHRFHDQHECSFDYKAQAMEKLRKENPKVVAKKIRE